MAQNYDNMTKDLFTDHATDLSRFVLGVADVEVLENLDTEQQRIIAQRTDTTKRIRVAGGEAICTLNSSSAVARAARCGHETQPITDTSSVNTSCPSTPTSSISIQMLEEMTPDDMNISGTVTHTRSTIKSSGSLR